MQNIFLYLIQVKTIHVPGKFRLKWHFDLFLIENETGIADKKPPKSNKKTENGSQYWKQSFYSYFILEKSASQKLFICL